MIEVFYLRVELREGFETIAGDPGGTGVKHKHFIYHLTIN